MSELDTVVVQLENQADILKRQERRLDKMEDAISKIAMQNQMLVSLQTQTDVLWKKYDDAFGPMGLITKVRDHQAQCPKDDVKRLWITLGILAMLWGGTLATFVGAKP